MKQFIKTHPKHTLLYGLGGTLVAAIFAMGGLIWTSSNDLYAEQANQSQQYVSSVSRALAGARSTSAAAQSQSSRESTAAKAPASNVPAPQASTPTPAPAATSNTTSGSNLKSLKLFVDPARAGMPAPLNAAPVATWLGGWNGDIQTTTNTIVTAATNAGSVATLVAYNIPCRDACDGYSAGGASSADAYKAWIRGLAAGIGNRKAVVILEPDSLAQITSLKNSSDQATRYALLQDAVTVLTTQTQASVYLDAGHSNWISATDMAGRLQKAGISQAAGFALNVSNFETTANNTSYGNTISSKVGGKHFVIDTSRNGNGPGDTWCNPWGRAIGETPSVSTSGNVDAYLWVKVPGESDGDCGKGYPSAGQYWSAYAQQLLANRR